ncbi:hypothetical protein AN958_07323 [Leucoagaricus sp. SymC.cos]|nr:hypothetical protein AN958_07323 [Leucoagaricus sp. SymC.cos]
MQAAPYIPPETQEETEQIDMLLELMGDFVNRTEALRVYRKHKGNVERAADAILNGDRGQDYNWDDSQSSTPPGYSQAIQQQAGPQPLKPSNTVIDLTGSDDELQRAVAMSLETEPTFGPSNRPPDSNWAMVPTNQLGDNPGLSSEEKSYNDAIQASLEDFASTNESNFTPINDNVREGLWLSDPKILHWRMLRCIELPNISQNTVREAPERALWNLIEVFTNLDLAQLAAIVDNEVLPSLMAPPLADHSVVGVATAEFTKVVAEVIETHLKAQATDGRLPRLMHFTHGHIELHRRMPRGQRQYPSESQVVMIEFGNEKIPYTDLISCLSGTLSSWSDTGSSHDVIVEPSDVFCFHLQRLVNEAGKFNPELFTFPKFIYLDQFLLENLELANESRMAERKILEEISELTRMKEGLTRHNSFTTSREIHILIRYDLRAVLMHTGLPGRKQIYSYVQDNNGTWWKTVDYSVTEVPEETVFSDPTGLHLGAGPYMLIYSQHVESEELVMPQWPRIFTESVEKHNCTFLSHLPPEVVAKAGISFTADPTPPPTSSSPSSSLPSRRLKSD